jgi:predicted nucleic acid-binding protein
MMQIVADTNVWLRIADTGAAQHSVAKTAVRHLLGGRAEIFLAPQNLVEFWAVATRPRELNGFGWSVESADKEIANLLAQFSLLPENDKIFGTWRDLVRSCQIAGKKVHDARLAAQLAVHNISHLLTFNDHDFRQFPGLTIVTPQSALHFI